MTLRKKVYRLSSSVILLVVTIIFLLSNMVLQKSFDVLERDEIRHRVDMVANIIASDISQLESTAEDWAFWDDTYEFVTGSHPDFVSKNLTESVYRNLRLNLFVLLSVHGGVVYGTRFDTESGQISPIPADLTGYEDLAETIRCLGEGKCDRAGIVSVSGIPMLLASRPLLTSEEKGPVAGTLIMGRYLDGREVSRLMEITKLRLDILRPSVPTVVSATHLSGDGRYRIGRFDDHSIFGFGLLTDIFHEPVLAVQVQNERRIYQEGQKLILVFSLGLLGFAAALFFPISLILEKFVLSPVSRITHDLKSILSSTAADPHVTITGHKELAELGHGINQILDSLQQRLRMQEIFTGISSDLAKAYGTGRDEMFVRVLSAIAGYTGAEWAGLYQCPKRSGKPKLTHDYGVQGTMIDAGVMDRIREDLTRNSMDSGGSVLALDGAQAESPGGNVRSWMVAPIYNGRMVIGFLCLATRTHDKSWKEDDQAVLRFAGEVIGHTMAKLHSERALQSSEIFLKETQRIARLGGWRADPSTDMLEWTEGVYDIIRAKRDNQPGFLESLQYYTPEYIPMIQDKIQGCMATGKPFQVEAKLFTVDGETIWAEVRGLMPAGNGAPSGILGTIQDVTERKRTEEALQASEERFHAFMTHLPGLAFIKDQDRRIMYLNNKFSIDDLPESKWIGRKTEEIWPGEIGEMLKKDDMRVLQDHQIIIKLDEVPRERGPRIYHTTKFPIPRPGNQTWLGGIALDVTEQKKAELDRSLFMEAVDASVNEIYIFDVQTLYFRYANKGALTNLGYSLTELGAMTPLDIKPEMSREDFDHITAPLLRKEKFLQQFETVHRRSDGSTYPASVHLQVFEHQCDRVFLAVIRDITEQRKMEGQFLQAQKMESVGRLAGGVAHDFNNMLQAILGYVELSLQTLPAESHLHENLGAIRTAALRSAGLTRQLLGFARKQIIHPQILNLNDTLEGMLKMLRRVIGEDIELTWRPGHGLWNVRIDPGQVDQILMNLAVNSRDAITGSGCLP